MGASWSERRENAAAPRRPQGCGPYPRSGSAARSSTGRYRVRAGSMIRRTSSWACLVGNSAVASSQSTSGSARNQVRWRFANATLRWASSSIAWSSVSRAVEDRPRLAVADRAERREARVEALAEAARLVEEAGVELGPRPRRDPASRARRVERQAEPRRRGRDSRAARAAARRPRSRRSRGRARRAGGSAGRPAPPIAGAIVRRRSTSAGSPSVASRARGERGPPGSLGSAFGIEAARDGAQVQARPADEDRDAAALRRSPRAPSSAWVDEVRDA